MNNPKFKGETRKAEQLSGRPRTVLKSVNCGANANYAIVQIDSIITKMEKSGYLYVDHIDISGGDKILVFQI